MRGTSTVYILVACACSCGTGDNRVDPAELELRDLLGVAPETATAWDDHQRAAARGVLDDGLDAADAGEPLAPGELADALADLDARREQLGEPALGAVRVTIDGASTIATPRAARGALAGGAPTPVELVPAEGWRLSARELDVLSVLALDLGHVHGTLPVAPAPRLAAIAAYVPGDAPRLVVNPVLLAALDPDAIVAVANQPVASAPAPGTGPVHVAPAPESTANTAGNPYSFYGSYEECAAAQQDRCNACLPSNSCVPITNLTDGNAECTMLAANNGRGYFLECINLALAITSVDRCTSSSAPACPQDPNAAYTLADLENNAMFLDDATCASGLDSCLAKIYGAPSTTFPGLDGGMSTTPPRTTNVSCGNSCSNNQNCQASPNCSCNGPSCNNSLSCDSGCGSGKGCDACSGGGGTSSGGGCSGGSSSSSGSCGSCGGGTSSGGSCDSCGSSSSSSSGCNSCGGSSSSSSSCGSCGGSSSGGCSNGKCEATREPGPGFALVVSIAWAVMPVPLAAFARRRARRKEVKS